jgi:carbon storage regulator
MLVLSRKAGEKIMIGDDLTLVVLEVKPSRVKLGFEAPGQVGIFRGELLSSHSPGAQDHDAIAEQPRSAAANS